jgi:hypothetical protein
VLSDGQHFQQGMLATQKNDIISQGLRIHSIIQLDQFMCNNVQNRRFEKAPFSRFLRSWLYSVLKNGHFKLFF